MKDMIYRLTLSVRYATTDRMTSNMCLVYRYRRGKASSARSADTLNLSMAMNYQPTMSAHYAITGVMTLNRLKDRRKL